MVYIKGYGCVNAAGVGRESFWSCLSHGVDNSKPVDIGKWPESVSKYLEFNEVLQPRSCQFSDRHKFSTVLDSILDKLTIAYDEALTLCGEDVGSDRLGIIFASTKGITEDLIWSASLDDKDTHDTHNKVLISFCEKRNIKPTRTLCISNACASSHAAIYVANKWINNDIVDDVIVIAADIIGPFIYSGFTSLKSLCSTRTKPFDKDRDGLQLGDGAAALILSRKQPKGKNKYYIAGIELDSEGFAITKPSIDGSSLLNACKNVLNASNKIPDVVIAHGTGTITNDVIEDTVITSLFPKEVRPYVTGTKWCIGHTLGPSGCMDLIAACEILSNQLCFGIANSKNVDPSMKANYVIDDKCITQTHKMSNVMVNSLGFGGYHASMIVCSGD